MFFPCQRYAFQQQPAMLPSGAPLHVELNIVIVVIAPFATNHLFDDISSRVSEALYELIFRA